MLLINKNIFLMLSVTIIIYISSSYAWSNSNLDTLKSYKIFKEEIPFNKSYFCDTAFDFRYHGNELSNGEKKLRFGSGYGIEIKKLDHRIDNSQIIFDISIDDHCFITNKQKKDYIWGQEAILNRCYFFKDRGVVGEYYGEFLNCKERYIYNKIHNIKCVSEELDKQVSFVPNGSFYYYKSPPMDDWVFETKKPNHKGVFAQYSIKGGNTCRTK